MQNKRDHDSGERAGKVALNEHRRDTGGTRIGVSSRERARGRRPRQPGPTKNDMVGVLNVSRRAFHEKHSCRWTLGQALLKLLSPILRTRPSSTRASIARHVSV